MDSPTDFLNIGGDTSQDVGGPFCLFGYFLVFNSFGDIVCLNDQQGLGPIHVVNQQFYFHRLFAALARGDKFRRLCHSADRRGLRYIRHFGRLCHPNHWLELTILLSKLRENSWLSIFFYTESLYLEQY